MTVYKPSVDSEEAWGLTFPINLALGSRLLRLPAARIGDVFFSEWRAEIYPEPVLMGVSDVLMVAVEVKLLDALGVDLRDERTEWRPDPVATTRLREAIAIAWWRRPGVVASRGFSVVLGGEVRDRGSSRAQIPFGVDLHPIEFELQRRAARLTADDAHDPLGEEIADWLYDARRSAYQANRAMQESPPTFDGTIDSKAGPLSIRSEMFDALGRSLSALDATIERVEALDAALREER
jgi:hypothetical protein